MSTAPPCDACSIPTNHGFLCQDCVRVLADNLTKLVWLWDEVTVTQVRQARTGKDRVGGKSSTTPLPFHEGASQVADLIHNTTHTWASALDHVADTHIEPSKVKPTLEWMVRNVHAFARLENAGQPARAFDAVVCDALVAIDHPIDRIFAGRCTLDKYDDEGCDADLYALPGDTVIECWLCPAVHDLQDRRKLMLSLALDWVDTAARLEKFFLMVGHKVPAGTIRYWASSGLLTNLSFEGEQPAYMVREVLVLKYPQAVVADRYPTAC